MARMEKDRSLPHKRPFVGALVLASLHYLSLVAITGGIVLLFQGRNSVAGRVISIAATATALTWLVAYFKRRSARCPLCRGTPFLDSAAHTHQKARRLFPLNYGTTAMLDCIFTQRFRCMYCGNRYDMLKPTARELHNSGR